MSKAVVNDLLQLRYATTACNNALWLTAVDAIDALWTRVYIPSSEGPKTRFIKRRKVARPIVIN